MAAKIPEGSQALTPYLAVEDAPAAIEFYRRVFGAEERFRMDMPDGQIGYASLSFGGAQLMLSSAIPQSGYRAPGGEPPSSGMYLYVDDVDAVFRRAIDAGATSESEPADMFWGDRWSRVTDPFGHSWELATHVEDIPAEEMRDRMMAGMPQAG